MGTPEFCPAVTVSSPGRQTGEAKIAWEMVFVKEEAEKRVMEPMSSLALSVFNGFFPA